MSVTNQKPAGPTKSTHPRGSTAQTAAKGGKAEENLPEAQQLFATIFHASPTAMVLSRLSDGRIVEVNERFLKLTGYTSNEVVGLTSTQAGITADPQARKQRLAALKRNGQLTDFDIRVITKSGEIRNGLATVGMIELNGEQFALSTFIDITERKQAEEGIKYLSKFPDENLSPVLRLDGKGIILYANKASQALLQEWNSTVGAKVPVFWKKKVAEVLKTGSSQVVEVPIGASLLSLVVTPIVEPGCVNLYGSDITERKRAERQLVQMKRLYATLSQVNQTIVRIRGRDELYQSICDVAVKFGEFSLAWIGLVDEVSGNVQPVAATGLDARRWPFEIVNVRKGANRTGLVAAAVRSGKVVTSEDVGVDKRTRTLQEQLKQYGYHSSAAVPIRLHGKTIGVLGLVSRETGLFKAEEEVSLLQEMGLDISFALDTIQAETEHKKAEATRDRLASIVDASEDGILSKNLDGVITSWNRGAERLYGYSPEQAIGRPISLIIPPERSNEMTDILERIRRREYVEHYETRRVRKDGQEIDVSITVSPILNSQGTIVGASSIARDISERKRAEEQRQQGENLLRKIIDLVPHFIFAKDIDGRFVLVNQAVAQAYGTSVAELTGKSDADFANSAQEVEQFRTKDLEVIRSGRPLSIPEEPITDAEGHVRLLQTVKIPFEFSGSQVGILGVSVDITERKRAEEAARESERQMTALVTSLDDIVFEFDRHGTYLNAWAADESLLTRPREQLLGRKIIDILGEENGRPFEQAIGRVVASRQPENIEYPLEVVGGQRWFLARINPILTAEHACQSACMLIRDITEHKHAEERIQNQVERLNSLREIDTVISSSFDMKFSLEAIVTRSVKELHVDAADILVLNAGSTMLEYQAGSGFHTKAFQDYELQIGQGVVGRCILERKSIHIQDLREHMDEFRRKNLLTDEKFIGYYCIPLINKREIKGVLEIFQRSPLEPGQDWVDFLHTLAGQAAIAIESATLFEGLQRSNMELALAYDETIEGWSRALDLRDKETEGHTQRVTELTNQLARAFGFHGTELQYIRRGALLHDIGKLGVPDEILFKPGPLTKEEWGVMRKHPKFAYDLLSPILYLQPALDIPYCHHEKWDGTGYPRGLQGEQIPQAARLFAVVDVWDALRHDRPYRAGWSADRVLEHIRSLSGTHFDPRSVELFFQVISENAS